MTAEKKSLNPAYLPLRASPLFKGLEEEAMCHIIDALKSEQWPKHRVVMTPEDTMHRFYLLVKGRVKVVNQNPKTGRMITLFLLGPGDGFNVISLLGGQRHELTVETLDDVEALSAPVEQWIKWLGTYPALHLAMHRYVISRLHELSELASDLALYDTMTRLVHLILRYFGDSDGDLPNRSNLIKDLPHAELAHMIGTVRVVVNRLLGELRDEGLINTGGGELHVKNLEKLLQKAEHYIQT
jgi:CRP/FNR family transcriptional regulator, cyclic AMP receptor protein